MYSEWVHDKFDNDSRLPPFLMAWLLLNLQQLDEELLEMIDVTPPSQSSQYTGSTLVLRSADFSTAILPVPNFVLRIYTMT